MAIQHPPLIESPWIWCQSKISTSVIDQVKIQLTQIFLSTWSFLVYSRDYLWHLLLNRSLTCKTNQHKLLTSYFAHRHAIVTPIGLTSVCWLACFIKYRILLYSKTSCIVYLSTFTPCNFHLPLWNKKFPKIKSYSIFMNSNLVRVSKFSIGSLFLQLLVLSCTVKTAVQLIPNYPAYSKLQRKIFQSIHIYSEPQSIYINSYQSWRLYIV